MPNENYSLGRQKVVAGTVLLLSDNLKVVLVDAAYSPDTSETGDEFLADIPSGARIVTSGNLASKTALPNGFLDFADPVFTGAAAGKTILGGVLYKDTGSAATSPLLSRFDQGGGLPLLTDSTDITMLVNIFGFAQL